MLQASSFYPLPTIDPRLSDLPRNVTSSTYPHMIDGACQIFLAFSLFNPLTHYSLVGFLTFDRQTRYN